ncbi:MAG: hypothetical protein QOD86_1927, partial [Miltoncostaeaceae bacterium]|nr:hypothetical protein [Miltoncostaeaceae bacterium]
LPETVHPLQPRFSQAITGVLCLEALLFQTWPVVAVALGLVVIGLAAPRFSPVTWVFRQMARPPASLEPAAPVRFSQGMAVAVLGAATICLAAGADLAGWILTGMVAGVALLSAIGGVCIGCELYRLALRRRGEDDDLRPALGLDGAGPWLVVLTAPGCARCEPAARALEQVAEGRPVVRVNIRERPEAAAVPVRSVPAALAVGSDGRLRAARAGRLETPDLTHVLAALGAPA